MKKHLLLLAGLAVWITSAAATADDKDLLKRGTAPPNLLIVFGNSQTTEQPIQGNTSAWDGDADSPGSKMGVAKAVLRQFIQDRHDSYNIGLTGFSHGQSAGSVILGGKHWLYSPLTEDFPLDSWKEPTGTIERWGPHGEGPCTNLTVPACTDRSPNFVILPSSAGVEPGSYFFGNNGAGTAYICLDGTKCNDGSKDNATKRIQVTLTAGKYGDAFTDGTLSAYTIPTPAPAHSMAVTKVFQKKVSGTWQTQATTPGGSAGTVTVNYVPAGTLTSDFFYTAGPAAGKEIGFLNDNPLKPTPDISTGASCGGWEFQASSAPLPLVKIPRDYMWGATCGPPQDSLPCLNRMMRPQAKLVSYDQGTGVFTPDDYDNPGYLTGAEADKYADGCDRALLGAVDAGLNVIGRQAILQTTPNASQAPIKNLLQQVYDYLSKPSIDGFQNGIRTDDPSKTCRTTSVLLVYDSFNGCQNDSCGTLTSQVLASFKQINVPVYVIGYGALAETNSATGICIAHNTGAILPDGSDGYIPVLDPGSLYQALNDIASYLNQSQQTFATSAVSASEYLGDQMAYFASFSATLERSIWNGRLNGYRLNSSGQLQLGQFTITDPYDNSRGATIPVPSNDPSSLIWNAGQNLRDTPGKGATERNAILQPGDSMLGPGSYSDASNDTVTTIPTHFYPGRKIVFSLPQTVPNPLTTLPIPAALAVPENRYDMIFKKDTTWWPTLKALLGPQTSPPGVRSPALSDDDAGKSLRFIWGDRDAVTGATDAAYKYFGLKLGDIVHSGPLLVGGPTDFVFFKTNAPGYQSFFNKYKNRRRVLYVGANDGLLHAFDAGVWDRDTSVCPLGHCYDLGTGVELFAFAPRSIMQIYKPLKDAEGPQTKQDEWTVDLAPSAADVFIDASHSGTPVPADRAWHTVLVGGVREGSPFEGTNGASPRNSQGSYFALDITQPDEIVGGVESAGTFAAPKCLNASGDSSCARDWPTVLWEITDTNDADSNGAPDIGEVWSKPAMGRVKVCTANCGTSTAVNEDHYVAIFGGGFDRERLNTLCTPACNRRGNWLYIVDVETGFALYKVNSGIANFGSGNVSVYFGSIPSGPTALDYDGDGYFDVIYVGDLKGQLWRVDLTDLRKLSSPPSGRFDTKLDLASGSGKPFLFFQTPQPTSPATTPFYPIYHRPEAINLDYVTGGKPALGIAFGTGDRDDVAATMDRSSLQSKQRYYYVVDKANTTTRRESDLFSIASPTAAATSSVPANGWFLQLINGERMVGDTLTAAAIIRFPTFNPVSSAAGGGACGNPNKCNPGVSGVSRMYVVSYANGNPYPISATDRGQTQDNAMFITAVTGYLTTNGEAWGLYYSGGVHNPPLGVGKKVALKSWKERSVRR